MRRVQGATAAAAVAVAWLLGCGWLGCNALLGNESAVFEPDASTAPSEGGTPDAPPDEVDRADGSTDANVDAAVVHPCTDTKSDTFNCGECGHDCLGGACNAGICAPVVIANDPGEPAEIAIDATHVYWTNSKTASVRRAPIAGGAVETIFDAPDGTLLADGVVRVGGDVYFAIQDVDGGIYKCPAAGCGAMAPSPVVAPVRSPGFIAVTAGGVLLTSESAFDGRIGRCTLPCAGGFEYVTAAQSFPQFVAAEGNAVYWSTIIPGPGNLRGKADNAAPEVTLVPNQAALQMAVSGSEVIFAARGSGMKGVPRAGGTVRRVYEPNTQSERFALDGTQIYFNDTQTATGRILRCPVVGCGDAGTTMASLQARPNAIVVDKTSIYWTNRGDGNTGSVMRVAK